MSCFITIVAILIDLIVSCFLLVHMVLSAYYILVYSVKIVFLSSEKKLNNISSSSQVHRPFQLETHNNLTYKWSPVPLAQVNPLQNRETPHVNIVLQCMYQFFEQPNMKGNRA